MNTWKQNLEETKRRYVDWWNHRGIIVNMWEHFQTGVTPHADVQAPPPPQSLDQKWFDPQWRADYLDWYVAHSSLKADMLPVANTQLGPGSLAAILGGVFEGGEDTIWIHPNPDYSDDIVFDPQHPNYLLHKELLRACKAKAQGHYYVGMPDLMEGMDVLAAMKGTDKVLLDTVMQPEVLEHQMQQINDIYFQVFDELYDIIREGDEMAFCYFSSWAPGKMSKLQSDISTMISVDDYRRFVQPFIREQCQKIDYTLYHLDGVGATHHLPALLEIEELNAIQWTPGVGEPQGGSPKWYDLYRRILDAGKSIMACWVTLDELRPLLDNIGGNGVHLEMDFHNEDEVEQALRIVEEYQESVQEQAEAADVIRVPAFDADVEVQAIIRKVETSFAADRCTVPADRILVLDGAMGTMIQQYQLCEDDFRGVRYATHPKPLMGCNDVLSLTCPVVIREIHRRYLEAGADIITTNTFNAQRITLGDYGLHDDVREINLVACRLARALADDYTSMNPRKSRLVAGSVGPTSRTCSMATGSGEPLDKALLRDAYQEQAEALLEGGVDLILVETIFDTLNARMAIEAAVAAMDTTGRRVPLMLSFSVATPDGMNMLGQNIIDFIEREVLLLPNIDIFAVGLNCTADITRMIPFVLQLAARLPLPVSCYPNAGKPDRNGRYSTSPEEFQRALWPLIEGHLLNIVGGCCGTTDQYIAKLAQLVQPVDGLWVSPRNVEDASERPTPTLPVREREGNAETAGVAGATETAEAEEKISLYDSILAGKSGEAVEAARQALANGMEPQEMINGQMIRAMEEVGRRFQDGKAFVPQLLMAGRAMKSALELLKPLMAGSASASLGKVVIGTVKGDLHDIGKNLVASMLEGCGFEVVNIGIDVSADTFVDEIRKNQPDILCMSALLTTTMGYMKVVIDALEAAGLRQQVKVMVGGAPVSQAFANEIGADGYSDNANSAVTVAKQLMGIAS